MKLARLVFVAVLALAAVAAACGGDDNDDGAQPVETTQASTSTSGSATAPAAGSTPPAPEDGEAEVIAIVGAVITDTRTIEINQLSGPNVTRIEVTDDTAIRKVGSGEVLLSEIRPSDRIVARGEVEGDVLVAIRILILDVAPGAQPGG
ncbi:MAG: hypothetical protein WEB52_04220 [Dehalococcoidia bacterium]